MSIKKSRHRRTPSYVDSHFAFDDLNASFKRLFKTFVEQENVYKPSKTILDKIKNN